MEYINKVVNADGTVLEVEMTDIEIAAYEKRKKEILDNDEKVKKQNADKLAAKNALLQKLGITDEEAKLLLS